jgi:hypothetical protein
MSSPTDETEKRKERSRARKLLSISQYTSPCCVVIAPYMSRLPSCLGRARMSKYMPGLKRACREHVAPFVCTGGEYQPRLRTFVNLDGDAFDAHLEMNREGWSHTKVLRYLAGTVSWSSIGICLWSFLERCCISNFWHCSLIRTRCRHSEVHFKVEIQIL